MEKLLKNIIIGMIFILVVITTSLSIHIKKQEQTINTLNSINTELLNEVDSLNQEISRYQKFIKAIRNSQFTFYVTVTMYNAEESQTDNTPLITADNTFLGHRIDTLKYIAISRDLHKRYGGPFNFGDKVLLLNSGHKIGIYMIKDIMNKRYKRYIDILEPSGENQYKFKHAFIINLNNIDNIQQYADLFDGEHDLKG